MTATFTNSSPRPACGPPAIVRPRWVERLLTVAMAAAFAAALAGLLAESRGEPRRQGAQPGEAGQRTFVLPRDSACDRGRGRALPRLI